jgi:chromosome segregation ATPase
MSLHSNPPTRGNGGRKRSSAADQPKSCGTTDQRDVRSKLTDFTRILDDIVVENEESKQELATVKRQLAESSDQLRVAKEEKEAMSAEVRELLTRTNDLETMVDELNEEKLELRSRIDGAANSEAELNSLRGAVASIKSHLRDYITLETTGVSLLTTTGQVFYWFASRQPFIR